jgi:putative N6-adenine-specific DNA methylase
MKLFAICLPGLDPFMLQELEQLGPSSYPSEETGGIEFEGSLFDVYRCNLHLRTASRILVRLGSFYAVGFPELRRKAGNLPWEDYLNIEQPIALRVACHTSRLYHQQAVAERMVGAISDRLKRPIRVAKYNEETESDFSTNRRNPPQLIFVRLLQDQCTISIDSSGDLLHRRGYRLATAKAPLRETLAAGMILASGWDRVSPLLDPFCGSGTIAIEAAQMAHQIPPGVKRHFAFMDWPNFDRISWNALLSDALSSHPTTFPRIIASDRDEGAIRAAHANAERAGVGDCIEFSCRAISAIEPPPGPGWVVTNPPYGLRIKANRDLRNLYAQFGRVLRTKCQGWQVMLLCSSIQLLHQTGLELDKGIPLVNGGIRVRLTKGTIK